MNRSDSRLTGACRRVENDHPRSLYDYTVWAFVFLCYACRRHRPMIQTYAVIIATTLNTIRYSMLLAHSSKGNENGRSPFSSTLLWPQPEQGWPQRSQLQPATASASPSFTLAGAAFCNSNLVCTVSSFKKESFSCVSSFFCCTQTLSGSSVGALHKDWLLLCKICLSVAESMAQKKLV